ncbi:MAG TPA: TRAP transporter substrate-binding protein, partial [Bacillota bacterium]|nr:TRAP transporter substrate-binding protein [Bacillota bacterium]
PFVIKDFDHFQRVWKSRLGKDCRKLIEKNGNMVCLSTLYRGFRQTTANKSLNIPNDFVGLRLRLPLVPDWVTVWEALGTAPVQFPLDQLYTVLKDQQAESSEGDLAQIASYNLHEVQTHLILTNHLVAVGWATANKKFFNSLSCADREIIFRNMEKAAEWATIKTKLDEGKYLNNLKNAGMIVVTPDASAIRDKAEPAVNNLFKNKYPVTTWAEILKI